MMDEAEKRQKAGIVYISRIPPSMVPHELRSYLEPFGKIGRIYLAPDEKGLKGGKSVRDPKSHRKTRFTEGWVEFERRKDAKTATLALNGSIFGGKKTNRFHDEMWNIKYLKDFTWSNLNEHINYEKAIRQQKMRVEVSQARKANNQYLKQVERAHEHEKIAETRERKRATLEDREVTQKSIDAVVKEQMSALKTKFKQRKVIKKEE
jgi:ESF2/ABP1 family protein